MRTAKLLLWTTVPVFMIGCSAASKTAGYPSRKELKQFRRTGADLVMFQPAGGLSNDVPGAQAEARLSERLRAFLGHHPNEKVRKEAAEDLAYSPGADTIAALNKAVTDDASWKVRREAIRSLVDLRSTDSFDTLIHALRKDPRWTVREAAARAIGALQLTDAIEHLREAADYDPDWEVRYEAEDSLVRLDPDYKPRYSRYHPYYYDYCPPFHRFHGHYHHHHHRHPHSSISLGLGFGF